MREYLRYVDKSSESPDLYHIWSALSAAGALCVRNAWLDLGSVRVYPNQYIILVGPGSARKGSAINIIRKLIEQYSIAKFAPTDTAGARQGVLSALRGDISFGDTDEAIEHEFSKEALDAIEFTTESDANELYIHSTQFATFLGQKQFDLLQCLTYCYKCPKEYSYKLKNTEEYVAKPTINILAATGTESLYQCLPQNSTGAGFLSQCVLVYAGKAKKRLPRPRALSKEVADELIGPALAYCRTIRGGFGETPKAQNILDDLYDYQIELTDARFIEYANDRDKHLTKAALALCMLDRRNTLTAADILDAQYILQTTEAYMPDALGEYGLNPVTIAKQRIVDILTNAKQDQMLVEEQIYNLMNRDVQRKDYLAALNELHVTERIVRVAFQTQDRTRTMHKYTLAQRLSEREKAELFKFKSIQESLDEG